MRIKYSILKTIRNSVECRVYWAALTTLVLMTSCSTKDIVRDWSSNKDYDRNFDKVLIMGLINQISLRYDVEYEIVDAAHKFGLRPTSSMALLPPELGKPFDDIENVRERLQERGFDAILTVAIIDVTAERYIGPKRKYVPLVYYNRFGNYYYRTHAVVYKNGYFKLESRYFLETNLYELKAGTLVWSGRSTLFDPHDVERFVRRYAKKLFKELKKKGVIDG